MDEADGSDKIIIYSKEFNLYLIPKTENQTNVSSLSTFITLTVIKAAGSLCFNEP